MTKNRLTLTNKCRKNYSSKFCNSWIKTIFW